MGAHSDCSFEYPQQMFYLRNMKIIFVAHSYLKAVDVSYAVDNNEDVQADLCLFCLQMAG